MWQKRDDGIFDYSDIQQPGRIIVADDDPELLEYLFNNAKARALRELETVFNDKVRNQPISVQFNNIPLFEREIWGIDFWLTRCANLVTPLQNTPFVEFSMVAIDEVRYKIKVILSDIVQISTFCLNVANIFEDRYYEMLVRINSETTHEPLNDLVDYNQIKDWFELSGIDVSCLIDRDIDYIIFE